MIGGGLGNMIDRITQGYVVDMFELTLFEFPVFNLADCFLVVGIIAGAAYYLFFYDKYDKKDKDNGHHPDDGQ